VSLARPGQLHGLALWFDAVFKPLFYGEEDAEAFR
jgi:hypothetical protein